jgi:tRNA dimethylallyltransferase
MQPVPADCWFLTGTTASGKSSVGVELARLLNAEIISLDSMTLYRGMDVGTAKPAVQERAGIPHHLLDIVDPDQTFSLHDYLQRVHALLPEIQQRGNQVLFVGGTPLYLKALLRGVFEGPAADPEFRALVEQELERVGVEELHRRLQHVDPLSAARLHPRNTRRIIRALEVYKAAGVPISHLQLQFDERHRMMHARVVALQWPRATLHQRIDARVRQMFQAGLVQEVRDLLERFGRLSRTATQAVGYREVLDYLHGLTGLEEAIRRSQARTRRLARRQETWFRGLSEVRFLPMSDEPAQRTAERVLELAGLPPAGRP